MRNRLSMKTLGLVVIAMAVIAAFDAQIDQVSFWPLYIGPVIAVSWESGFRSGAVASAIAGALLIAAATLCGHPYSSDFYFLIATACQVAALLILAWYVSRLAATEAVLTKLLDKLQA